MVVLIFDDFSFGIYFHSGVELVSNAMQMNVSHTKYIRPISFPPQVISSLAMSYTYTDPRIKNSCQT